MRSRPTGGVWGARHSILGSVRVERDGPRVFLSALCGAVQPALQGGVDAGGQGQAALVAGAVRVLSA